MSEIDLEALAAKVEALEGPCRETDAEIADAVLGPVKPPYRRGHCEKYTGSIDSAMSLVPEKCWLEGNLYPRAAAVSSAEVHNGSVYDALGKARGGTPAIAITAASLRARAALSRLSPPKEVKHG